MTKKNTKESSFTSLKNKPNRRRTKEEQRKSIIFGKDKTKIKIRISLQ